MGLVRILGHVTLIVAIPMLGGALAGIALDNINGTAPAFTALCLSAGTIATVVGLWLYIRTNRPGPADSSRP